MTNKDYLKKERVRHKKFYWRRKEENGCVECSQDAEQKKDGTYYNFCRKHRLQNNANKLKSLYAK
ncbi:MAG: hypothetical protein H6743_03875 [Rickettsiaceae bacterium]|nr:hypothetical protein [Rickettsiaceae bacterium]